jgi:predicted murein hydrolase (TIGR00659 family)
MMEVFAQTTALVILTVLAYFAGYRVYQRVSNIFFNPIFTSPVLVIIALWLTHTDYSTYRVANEPLSFLLGPAQVAMAVPLYKCWRFLKRHVQSILSGVCIGTAAGVVSTVMIAQLLHFSPSTIFSLAPKFATTPVAMTISQTTGGIPELTAVFTICTGIFGMMAGPAILKWMGIKNNVAIGLAMGTAGQMVGAAHASKWGEIEGAMGIVGMSFTALLIGLLTPYLLPFLL